MHTFTLNTLPETVEAYIAVKLKQIYGTFQVQHFKEEKNFVPVKKKTSYKNAIRCFPLLHNHCKIFHLFP